MTSLTFTLGDALRKARQSAGLDQKDMADHLGVSRPTVSTWERGRTEPPFHAVVQWSRLTGVDLEWLAGSADDQRPVIHGRQSSVQLDLFQLAA